MQDAGWIIFGLFLGAIALATTGCSGLEVGGKLGVYRVDERQESQATHRQPMPLKCYFVNCNSEEAVK
jgi:hypothetical protein